MALVILLLVAALLLAFANGANDNFKGVATLFGSHTSDYRGALTWATITTLLGSLAAVFLAGTLLKTFSGKGLVADDMVANADYAAAVALGAGLTVLLATRMGLPISTTHSLIGALVGAGLAAGSTVSMAKLGGSFFLPLVLSPLLAIVSTIIVYPLFRFGRKRLGITAESCLCVGTEIFEIVPIGSECAAIQRAKQLTVQMGNTVSCQNRYQGQLLGIEAGAILDRVHFLSAGFVGFARGLNDTPKIAALLLLVPQLGAAAITIIIGISIAIGGVVSARRVAERMSKDITPMNHGQGFTANLLTSIIVIGASSLGTPASTTHVSCGALFGIGAITQQANWGTISKILAAWVTTLPLGAIMGAVSFLIIRELQ